MPSRNERLGICGQKGISGHDLKMRSIARSTSTKGRLPILVTSMSNSYHNPEDLSNERSCNKVVQCGNVFLTTGRMMPIILSLTRAGHINNR